MLNLNFKNSGRGYLEISFSWFFAVLVGIMILSLAIFAVTKIIKVGQTAQDVKVGKEIGILLNPLETSFEVGKTTSLSLPVETRIFNKCSNNGIFGKQSFQISQMSLNKWTQTDLNVSFVNKYVFSNGFVEGKKFYLFSKPFDMPFKIADLIFITSVNDEYCFVNPPEEISDELLALNQGNLLVNNCSDKSIRVCFGGGNCDISVNYNLNYVTKGSQKFYFEGDALMYAAVFSDKDVYECQLKRLMQRGEQLSLLYKNKATFVVWTGCKSNLDLLGLSNLQKSFVSSLGLASISRLADEIKEKNDVAECKLW